MVGAKLLGVAFGLGTLAIATKALSPALFGTVVFIHAYMLFFSEVATFQSWQSVIRFGTEDIENKDSHSLAKLIKFGIKLDALAAVAAYVLALLVFTIIVWFGAQVSTLREQIGLDLATLRDYAAIYCLLVLARQIGTSIGVFRLFDKFAILALEALVMPVIRFLGSIYALHAGWGLTGFLSVWFAASLMSYVIMVLMAAWELKKRRLLGLVFSVKSPLKGPRKGIWGFAIKSSIDSTLATGNLHLPTLLVMAVFGPAWNGVYKIAEEVAKFLSEGFKLLDQVIYPELAKLVFSGDASKIWRITTRAGTILLSIGLACSLLVLFAGEEVLTFIFQKDYSAAAPLASLLVPAAALLGIVAPLYPIFYAAHKPERAVLARGSGLLVYIVSFFIFSFTIGRLAPGFAAISGNIVAVSLVIFLARKTLTSQVLFQKSPPVEAVPGIPGLRLAGQSDKRIWGLSLGEWQRRAYKKAGVEGADNVTAGLKWVISSNLAKAFVASKNTALVAENVVIAVNGLDADAAEPFIGCPVNVTEMEKFGIVVKSPNQISGAYDKALRKSEAPYVVNTETLPMIDIMKRQFDSSYKGITDFVTKFIWPIPAFYVTRFCAFIKLTPNMVTTIGLILMFAALYFFWQGQWALGFATGWIMTFLDTVDGKLARTTMTYSAWGNIYDHGIDLIHPPFWYIAWFVGLGGVFSWPDVMTVSLVAILLGYMVDRAIEGIFIVQHGFHLHVWRPINSALRFITARRNPNMFIFMIGIILSLFWPEAGKWGFVAVALWTWLCIIFNIGVVIVGTIRKKPLISWMEARNES